MLDEDARRPVRPSSMSQGPIYLGRDLQGVLGSLQEMLQQLVAQIAKNGYFQRY